MEDGRTTITLKEDGLLALVQRSVEYHNADVYAFGNRETTTRLGEIAG